MTNGAEARRVLVLAGATATGKTAASIALSECIDIEVVSADARQVYRRLDIGTAKPTPQQQQAVRHHCIDIRNPADTYSAAEYAADARNAIDSVPSHALPVIVGGSGMYISAALDGLSEDIAQADPLLRAALEIELAERGRMGLFEELQRIDARAAERYADMNPRRVIRALEFYRSTGRLFSSTWDSPRNTPSYDVVYVAIAQDKAVLHQIIDARCDEMWNAGLLDEMAGVLDSGVPPTSQSLQSVGYSEAIDVLAGRSTPSVAIGAMKQNTRRYAKRQLTWFKRDQRYQWITGGVIELRDFALRALSPSTTVCVLLMLCAVFADVRAQDTTQVKAPLSTGTLSATDSATALQALRTHLDGLFGSTRSRKSTSSVMVYSQKQNAVVYELNAETMLAPASTTKLFSTAALFQRLGKNGVIATEIRTDGVVGSDGTLNGNVYIIGHGDALLSINDLEDVADRMRAMGIKRITGMIVGDGSAFDGVGDRSVYSGDGEHVEALPPVRALSMNKSGVAVVVHGAADGRASAQCVPSSDAFDVVIVAGPVPKGKKKRRRSRVRVSSRVLESGVQQFVVMGSPGANRSSTTYYNMAKPALVVAGALRSRLRAGGVVVDGTVAERTTPVNTKSVTANNRTIVEFCSIVNKRSDNFLAEHVFKAVGSLCDDNSNTASRAKRALLETLDSFDIRRLDCSFNDGSGLSRRNRASASVEVGLLRSIATQPWADEYISTLAIAGVDGTLRGRMKQTPAENNLRGKTGTLRNVSALAGYVKTSDGEPLVFSFISNGPSVGHYKDVETQAAVALASFSYRTPPTFAPVKKVVVSKKKRSPAKSKKKTTRKSKKRRR